MTPPAKASSRPGTMNPTTFHQMAFGVPRAPSSLIVFRECEYDGRSAPRTNEAAQNTTHAAIPRNPTIRVLVTSERLACPVVAATLFSGRITSID
jgi:hypothetical protein